MKDRRIDLIISKNIDCTEDIANAIGRFGGSVYNIIKIPLELNASTQSEIQRTFSDLRLKSI